MTDDDSLRAQQDVIAETGIDVVAAVAAITGYVERSGGRVVAFRVGTPAMPATTSDLVDRAGDRPSDEPSTDHRP